MGSPLPIRRVILTGATGFVGSHVAEALVREGFSLAILHRKGSDLSRLSGLPSRRVVYFDIDRKDLGHAFRAARPQAVVHLATHYKKNHEPEDVPKMVESNIGFPLRLLDEARLNKVSLFVNTGTFFEYSAAVLPVREDSARRTFNLYAMTKIAFETTLGNYCRRYGLRAATLKLFTPFGPRDNPTKLIPTLLADRKMTGPVSLSEGFQKLDFVYVRDAAEAFVACLRKWPEFPLEHELFNIAGGRPYSIREVVSLIERITHRTLYVHWGGRSVEDYDVVFADISKARRLLGWSPNYSLEEGLRETLEKENLARAKK